MKLSAKHHQKGDFRKKSALIWRFLQGSKHLFVLAVLFTCITALADMVIPQIIRAAIDNALGGLPADFPAPVMALVDACGGFGYLGAHIWIMALTVVAVALVKVVCQYLFRLFNTMATETLVKTTRDTLFTHIESLPFSWHMKNRTGDIIQRCTSDISIMRDFISEDMTSIFRIIILLILSLMFMLTMHVPLALVALIPTPLILIHSAVFDRKIEAGFDEFDENEGKLSAMVQENLTGVRVVRAFGRENSEKLKFHRQNSSYTDLGKKVGMDSSIFWCISSVLTRIQLMLVILFGSWFCIRGSMTAGEFIAFISYDALLTWPLNELGRLITQMSKTGVSIDRVRYIMEAQPEQDAPDASTPDLQGDIVFDHVQFAYENCPPVLKDVSFRMKAGTTLGILGGTGSGKTTLMMLLDKLYPLPEGQGTISIGGTDIRKIQTDYLRKNIGMVLQDPYLFSRTIGENISISDETMDSADIRRACSAACLDETIMSFTRGYDTVVGERGVTLSGGQKQRAAIARVLTQHTPILIFDDSLSAVDTDTDARIRASLEARFGSASIILISHRITTLSKADQIIVLEDGAIAQQGTHQQLIAQDGIYRRIYDIQTGNKEAEK